MRNDYVVYIHKNILNGKVYVGQTCNLSERWRNNGKNYFNSIKFYNAIKKYGWDNFTHEVVYSNLNKQAADKLEKELIHKYNSIEEGYNLKEGGSRGELSTKSLAKMSEIEAREVVSGMYHIEGGRKYIGEKFDMYKAKEVCERYRGLIPTSVTVCDVYVAINSQYHDYVELFKSWFSDGIEQKIVESAIIFWFKDVDCKSRNKVVSYFKEY